MQIALIAIAAVLSYPSAHAARQAVEGFPDVPKTHWAYEAVTDLKAKGILIGYPVLPASTHVQAPNRTRQETLHGTPSRHRKRHRSPRH